MVFVKGRLAVFEVDFRQRHMYHFLVLYQLHERCIFDASGEPERDTKIKCLKKGTLKQGKVQTRQLIILFLTLDDQEKISRCFFLCSI